jgi:hypothetical protein
VGAFVLPPRGSEHASTPGLFSRAHLSKKKISAFCTGFRQQWRTTATLTCRRGWARETG